MAGTLTVTWQNTPKDNLVMHNHFWWHSAKQIHPDTSLAADLIQLLQTKTFQFQKEDTFNSAVWYWLLRRTRFYSSGFCILGRSLKSLEEHIWGHVSQNRSLDKMFLYPQVSNISAPSVSMFITRLLENIFLSFCWVIFVGFFLNLSINKHIFINSRL